MAEAQMANFDNPSFFTGEYTYQWSKYSCSRAFFFIHVIINYLIFFVGIAAFATRLIPKLKWTHRWLGRAYIIFMLWSTASSMLIHNSGLPLGVLWSFLWVMLFMSAAWIIIVWHMNKMETLAIAKVESEIEKGGDATNLQDRITRAKVEIANAKTVKQRLLSYKAVHGVFMFVSWINIAGRIFVTSVDDSFQCYSYPVYKPINSKDGGQHANQTFPTLMPADDPKHPFTPWGRIGITGWAIALSVGPFFGAYLVGAIYTAVSVHGVDLGGKFPWVKRSEENVLVEST